MDVFGKLSARLSETVPPLSAPTLVGGIVLLTLGTVLELPHWAEELWRDLGIALLIASLVTLIYESHARAQLARETFRQILDKIIGDLVDGRLWREVHDQLLTKPAVRRTAGIRLRLELREGLPDNQCVLWTEMDYRLASLRSHEQKVPILHFLDSFMRNEGLDLPRFLRIECGNQVEPIEPKQGRFKREVVLPARDGETVPVRIEREEIVYLPGAYNLMMSELTDLESIALLECPPGVKVVVNCFFKEEELTTTATLRPNRYLLPSQCLEFRFEKVGGASGGTA